MHCSEATSQSPQPMSECRQTRVPKLVMVTSSDGKKMSEGSSFSSSCRHAKRQKTRDKPEAETVLAWTEDELAQHIYCVRATDTQDDARALAQRICNAHFRAPAHFGSQIFKQWCWEQPLPAGQIQLLTSLHDRGERGVARTCIAHAFSALSYSIPSNGNQCTPILSTKCWS